MPALIAPAVAVGAAAAGAAAAAAAVKNAPREINGANRARGILLAAMFVLWKTP